MERLRLTSVFSVLYLHLSPLQTTWCQALCFGPCLWREGGSSFCFPTIWRQAGALHTNKQSKNRLQPQPFMCLLRFLTVSTLTNYGTLVLHLRHPWVFLLKLSSLIQPLAIQPLAIQPLQLTPPILQRSTSTFASETTPLPARKYRSISDFGPTTLTLPELKF